MGQQVLVHNIYDNFDFEPDANDDLQISEESEEEED